MEERLQKILARAGYGSRRACEQMILEGRVTVNGRLASLGQKADLEKDQIRVDGRPVRASEPKVYIVLHKPRNVISSTVAQDRRRTVRDLVPLPGRLFPVGRLDADSEGLILMTNDGELANRLTHPRYRHEKEYRVLVGRRPDEKQLTAWRKGVVLEDGYRTRPAKVRVETVSGNRAWLRVTLTEGRKHQIREMGRLTGLPVLRLVRIRMGPIHLGALKPGQWRNLTERERRALLDFKPEKQRTSRRKR
jgi:23S rRNA pseudouridine2605 synthase